MKHTMIRAALVCLVLSANAVNGAPQAPEEISKQIIAPLLDPANVDTLKGDRPINARTYRVLYWLETARRAGGDVSGILATAQTAAGYACTPRAKADAAAIIINREKLDKLGCFTPEGMAELRQGRSPRITKGPEAGQEIHMDHIVPVSIAPELAARFYDLDAISERANQAKGARITQRELDLARRLRKEGLLSAEGLAACEAAFEAR